jgi:hypothetical protein
MRTRFYDIEGRPVVAKPMRTTVTAPNVKKEPNTVQGEALGIREMEAAQAAHQHSVAGLGCISNWCVLHPTGFCPRRVIREAQSGRRLGISPFVFEKLLCRT